MKLTLGTVVAVVAVVVFSLLAFQDKSWLEGGLAMFAASHIIK